MADNIKVAVRVRPFNKREYALGDQCIVAMEGQTTTITNPQNEDDRKTFVFDYSYWSFNNYGDSVCTQDTIMADLGSFFLDAAFEGFNSCIFAYGQTGAGKSYSIMGGHGDEDKGVIPRGCDALFQRLKESRKNPNISILVEISYLEIYNEDIRDLLAVPPSGGSKPKALRLRESPAAGIYVQGLSKMVAKSYGYIERFLEIGAQARTTAETKMNATSSRSHSVFTIYFTQTVTEKDGRKTTTRSKVNVVDLAGSERQANTGARGARLKEACAINKSLSALGNVVSALAQRSERRRSKFIPYRDSTLTRLLQESLGGNSKTVMLAAISPAASNYEETMSTLRFADRVKSITNVPKVNKSPEEALISDLKAEVARLEALLEGQNGAPAPTATSAHEQEELKAMIEAQNEYIKELKLTTKDKMERTNNLLVMRKEVLKDSCVTMSEAMGLLNESTDPYLLNFNADPTLNASLIYFLRAGNTLIGTSEDAPVRLHGLGMEEEHCFIAHTDDGIFIAPVDGSTYINGERLTVRRQLFHGDRVLFGKAYLFRYYHSAEEDEHTEVDWTDALQEVARALGWRVSVPGEEAGTPVASSAVGGTATSKTQAELSVAEFHDEVTHAAALADQANDMARAMGKDVTFSVDLVSSPGQSKVGGSGGGAQAVFVRITGQTGSRAVDVADFELRLDLMLDLYGRFCRGEEVDAIDADEDPFYDYADDVLVGTATVALKSLARLKPVRTKVALLGPHKDAFVLVSITPYDADSGLGRVPATPVRSREEAVGRRVRFVVRVEEATGVPTRLSAGVFAVTHDFPEAGAVGISARSKDKLSETVRWPAESKDEYDITIDRTFVDFLSANVMRVEVLGRMAGPPDVEEYSRVKGQRDEVVLEHEALKKEYATKVTVQSSLIEEKQQQIRDLEAAVQDLEGRAADNKQSAKAAKKKEEDLRKLRKQMDVLHTQLTLLENAKAKEAALAEKERAKISALEREKAALEEQTRSQLALLEEKDRKIQEMSQKSSACVVL